jgi:FkbM family methyltransferase
MNIEIIAEHSVDLDLLPEKAKILDLGCRGFLFTDELRRLGHNVLAVDCDKFEREDYFQIAISNKVGRVGIKRSNDPQATMIMEGSEFMCMDLKMLMLTARVEFFDLIKIDVEGAEYEIIMSLEKAPAKQISVEFHLHTGIYGENEMLLMENKLLWLGYFPVKHDKTKQHGLSYNYWDSLWILRN